jgi:hypothetical protein
MEVFGKILIFLLFLDLLASSSSELSRFYVSQAFLSFSSTFSYVSEKPKSNIQYRTLAFGD